MKFANKISNVRGYLESLIDAAATDDKESVVLLLFEFLTPLKDTLLLLDDTVFFVTKLSLNDLGDFVDNDKKVSFFGG